MKHILLAISGLTPQIVTETLFALSVQQKITIDEIYVITTERGKKVLMGKDKGKQTPKVSLLSQIKNLALDYNLKQPKFNIKNNVIVAEEESLKLFDIKTDKENILFPNKIAELLNKLSSNENNTIYASLSGGRKSMSAHLALVMSLFARSNDKLFHILTDEKFEFKNFYPKTKEEKEALVIAEIPFVKMRSLNAPLLKEQFSYSELVNETQLRMKLLSDNSKLILHIKKREIEYKGKTVSLTPKEMGLYLIFCESKIEAKNSINVEELQSVQFAANFSNKLSDYFNYYFDPNDKHHWSVKGISLEDFRSLRSKINKKFEKNFTNEEYREFHITVEKIWGNSSYKIEAPKEKIGINYE